MGESTWGPFVPELFRRLRTSERVLVAGAGGGFDVYAGLPLALALRALGKEVHLANLTFSMVHASDARVLVPGLVLVEPTTAGCDGYFPERTLARWLARERLPARVFAVVPGGVQEVRDAYRMLAGMLRLDAVVLVDGGTDLLVRGDEAGLGTPEEDLTSLAALRGVDVPVKLAACIGFGVDAYHGVCHAHFLENVAALERAGGYLGAFSVPRASEAGAGFLSAVDHALAETPLRPSLVNGQIASALRGEFGDVQFSERTRGSELFVNPLMGLYFTFDLEAVAAWSLLVEAVEGSTNGAQVSEGILRVRGSLVRRRRRTIPH